MPDLEMIKRWLRRFEISVLVLLGLIGGTTLATVLSFADRAGLFDPKPPAIWSATADANDFLVVPGREIEYWGKPDARYSRYATRGKKPPRAIVVHHTMPRRPSSLVRYGHIRDYNRGGASFGYHFYISYSGKIYQGAPLSVRTNHIKSPRRRQRTKVARHLWSGNTIAVSLIGACNPLLAPRGFNLLRCGNEAPTRPQLDAALDVIQALRQRFDIKCSEIYGHGELQTDRQSFEGKLMTEIARERCPVPSTTVDSGSS